MSSTPTAAPEAPTAPPVIATIPAWLDGPTEVCVRHEPWGVEVDVRTAGSNDSWTPLRHVSGGVVEVRTR